MHFKELLQNEIKSLTFERVEFNTPLISSNLLDSITLTCSGSEPIGQIDLI